MKKTYPGWTEPHEEKLSPALREHGRFTVADLVALLRSAPKPDAAFWDVVEEATKQQPELPSSLWEWKRRR